MSKNVMIIDDGLILTAGETIQIYRQRLGWSQAKLAIHSGISRNAISLIERDETIHPTADTLIKLLLAIGYKSVNCKHPAEGILTLKPSKEAS